jgi:hypothetical protein
MSHGRRRTEFTEDRSVSMPVTMPAAMSFAALRPRPRTLLALSIIFVAWVGILIGMYVKMVVPVGNQRATTTTAGSN